MRAILVLGWMLVLLTSPLATPAVRANQNSAPVAGADDLDGLEDEFALLEEALDEEEVASASKHRQPILWSPSAITVLTRDEIRASGAQTFADLLRRVPGFDVYEAKPLYPLVGARAMTGDRNNLVIVVIDGQTSLLDTTGEAYWGSLFPDLEDIERVEVIRGPGSALYGANAYAGVVNITTLREAPRATATLSAGEQGLHRLHARVGGLEARLWDGTLTFWASAGLEGLESPSDPDSRLLTVRARSYATARYRRDWLDLSLRGGYRNREGLMFSDSGGQINTEESFFTLGRAELAFRDDLKAQLQLYFFRTDTTRYLRYGVHYLGFWIADMPPVRSLVQTYDAQAQLDWRILERLLLIAGVQLRTTTLTSDNLIPQETDEVQGGGFLHAEWRPWDFLQAVAGLRWDHNSKTGSSLSPRGTLLIRPFDGHTFRLGFGVAFRKPTHFERTLQIRFDPVNEALFELLPYLRDRLMQASSNPELDNETVQSFELGWRGRWLDGDVRATVDLFFNRYLDFIYFNRDLGDGTILDPPEDYSKYIHSDDVVIAYGGEAVASWNIHGDFHAWANLGLRWVEIEETGEKLPSEPRLRINLGGGYRPRHGALVDLAFHYVSGYTFEVHQPQRWDLMVAQELGDCWLFIGRVGYRWSTGAGGLYLDAGLVVRTPLGEPFREFAGVPAPLEAMRLDRDHADGNLSDVGGELLPRLVSLYLRAQF